MKSKLSTTTMSEKAKNSVPLVRPANGWNYQYVTGVDHRFLILQLAGIARDNLLKVRTVAVVILSDLPQRIARLHRIFALRHGQARIYRQIAG